MTKSDSTGMKSDLTITPSDSTVMKSDSNVLKSDSAAAKSDSTVTIKNEDKGRKRTREESIKEEHSDGDEADALPAAKKQKDGQKNKSKSLNIPVDVGCSLAGPKLSTLRNFV